MNFEETDKESYRELMRRLAPKPLKFDPLSVEYSRKIWQRNELSRQEEQSASMREEWAVRREIKRLDEDLEDIRDRLRDREG